MGLLNTYNQDCDISKFTSLLGTLVMPQQLIFCKGSLDLTFYKKRPGLIIMYAGIGKTRPLLRLLHGITRIFTGHLLLKNFQALYIRRYHARYFFNKSGEQTPILVKCTCEGMG